MIVLIDVPDLFDLTKNMKKQQTIETLQNTLEWVIQEWINTKQELAEVRIELEETQEALRRSRNQITTYKEWAIRSDKLRERWITQNWFLSDWYEWIVEVLPWWIDEDMIERKLIDKDQKKIAILLK